jgi:hypothetical protein
VPYETTWYRACSRRALPLRAFASGEIFKIEPTGTEYWGHFDVTKFGATNNIDLWVLVVSDTELTVSFTPNFAAGTTFSMFDRSYQTGATSAEFIGGVFFVDNPFATIEGKAKFSRTTGEITSLTGNFIQDGVIQTGCFSRGKFKSQRVA